MTHPGAAGAPAEDAWASAEAVRSGRISARDALDAALQRIADRDGELNAFTVLLAEQAAEAAAQVDSDLAAGGAVGPLAGVPVSVKDHIWLRAAPATNGSRALASFVPDADCVAAARLRAAGALIVGKTNNPEFCYRGVTDNEVYGLTRNPRDSSRTPGGSSGGAAASVAAGMVPLALGTDGGGSIRIPAAFCGVYGLKPTFGLVPKLPGFRGWPTLSVTGPIAASARDLALAISVLAGPSSLDDLSYPARSGPADYLAAVTKPQWAGLRIACSADLGLGELGLPGVDADVRAAFERAISLIGTEVPLERAHPAPQDLSPLWDVVALAEGFASEGPLLAASPGLVGADAAAIVRAGAAITARDYLDAQHRRSVLAAQWARFFESYDVLLTPTMPVTAFPTGRLAPAELAGVAQPDSFDTWCALALPANLAGLPAISIPAGTGTDGLPVGLQLIGPRWSEATLLRAAVLADAVLADATRTGAVLAT